jgi:hypothetical protein
VDEVAERRKQSCINQVNKMVESSKAIQIFAEVFTKETSNKAYYA